MNMQTRKLYLLLIFFLIFLPGCVQAKQKTLSFNILNEFDTQSPVDNQLLTMPENAVAPKFTFEGRLELLNEADNGSISYLRYGSGLGAEANYLPDFDFEFVQNGNYIIPEQQGLIITTHPLWNYILEPGQVWQESNDKFYSRASLPFFLIPKNGNSTFHGVMTFLYNDTNMSKVWYQITQETSAYERADLWGLLEATYHPGSVDGSAEIQNGFTQELAQRVPTKPFAQIEKDYPGVKASAFIKKLTPEHLTTYGLIVNGVHYRGGCQTRYGEYPFCEFIRMPSFSTAKSAFVSLALMRLAQKYGPQVADQLIKDYVTETVISPGDWSKVTFDNTLDMATGNYNTPDFMVDEEARIFEDFIGVESYAEKIAAALDWPHRAEPGTRWVYRSSDTFIVTAALQNYLRTKEGPDADLFDFVVREVYQPAGLGPGVFSTLRTSDHNWRGQPVGVMGMWWIPDDIAKLAIFLNTNRGAVNGEQILHPALLASAMQADPADRGLNTPSGKYNNAFWADYFTQADGFDCEFYVPYWAGYSGIVVALMPNGVTFYYFSDNREFDWRDAVHEADKIKPLCPSTQ